MITLDNDILVKWGSLNSDPHVVSHLQQYSHEEWTVPSIVAFEFYKSCTSRSQMRQIQSKLGDRLDRILRRHGSRGRLPERATTVTCRSPEPGDSRRRGWDVRHSQQARLRQSAATRPRRCRRGPYPRAVICGPPMSSPEGVRAIGSSTDNIDSIGVAACHAAPHEGCRPERRSSLARSLPVAATVEKSEPPAGASPGRDAFGGGGSRPSQSTRPARARPTAVFRSRAMRSTGHAAVEHTTAPLSIRPRSAQA